MELRTARSVAGATATIAADIAAMATATTTTTVATAATTVTAAATTAATTAATAPTTRARIGATTTTVRISPSKREAPFLTIRDNPMNKPCSILPRVKKNTSNRPLFKPKAPPLDTIG